MSGVFITFDGVDGCGKSSQVSILKDTIQQSIDDGNSDFDGVIVTREPGDTDLGLEIRRLLLSDEHVPVPEAELFLFLADRAQHVREVIQPALENNMCVICDRFTDSTRAYQKAARGISSNKSFNSVYFEDMLSLAECGTKPDVRLWLDISTTDALDRLAQRSGAGGDINRLDLEGIDFHQKVNQAYHEQYALEFNKKQGTLIPVVAKGSMEDVSKRINAVLNVMVPSLFTKRGPEQEMFL